MYIGSGLNTVSSLYGQQKGNQMKTPASGEKTFYTAETPKVYQIFTTDNMLWTGGNGTGLSYCLKYADDSTDENPVVLAKGVDENGKEFEQRIYINDVNPSNATVVDHIKMEPDTLDLHYLNSEGDEIAKKRLSAGEKQLMVISLLWALAICSKKKLPVIIDTPLSRLDSAHRRALIKTYFPKASDQTIILSTDSEIDETYYKLMKKSVGDEFTLKYNDKTKNTTIVPGYFGWENTK